MENFIYSQYGERLAILNTENIRICGWITKLEAIKNDNNNNNTKICNAHM